MILILIGVVALLFLFYACYRMINPMVQANHEEKSSWHYPIDFDLPDPAPPRAPTPPMPPSAPTVWNRDRLDPVYVPPTTYRPLVHNGVRYYMAPNGSYYTQQGALVLDGILLGALGMYAFDSLTAPRYERVHEYESVPQWVGAETLYSHVQPLNQAGPDYVPPSQSEPDVDLSAQPVQPISSDLDLSQPMPSAPDVSYESPTQTERDVDSSSDYSSGDSSSSYDQ